MYGTHQKNSTFLFKKRILPYATWGILQKEPLVEAGARIPPSMPLQGMLSASGSTSNWKRRLSAPGDPGHQEASWTGPQLSHPLSRGDTWP